MFPTGMIVKVSSASLKCISDLEGWSFRDSTRWSPGLKTAQSSKKHYYQMFNDCCEEVFESLTLFLREYCLNLRTKTIHIFKLHTQNFFKSWLKNRMCGKEVRITETVEDEEPWKAGMLLWRFDLQIKITCITSDRRLRLEIYILIHIYCTAFVGTNG